MRGTEQQGSRALWGKWEVLPCPAEFHRRIAVIQDLDS